MASAQDGSAVGHGEQVGASKGRDERREVAALGISGSYGGKNLGDEAILSAMVGQLRRAVPVEITVFTRDPQDTLRRHGVERAVPIRKLTRSQAFAEVARLDLLILGGGGILYDGDAEAILREATLAHEAGIPVVVYAVSAGPLAEARTRKLVRVTLNRAAAITVRDRQAGRLLEELGIRQEIRLTSDPALLLEPEPVAADVAKREGLDEGRRCVAISVREPGPAAPELDIEHYHELLANAADFVVDRLAADIAFVPLERRNFDIQHSHAVISRMQCAERALVLKGDYTPGQLLTLMRRFDFAIGMRLHFLIFAALQGVPFIPLPYAPKVSGFVEDLGIQAPAADRLSAGRLIAHIDSTWDHRAKIREQIESMIPELRARALESHRVALEVLADKRGATGRST